MVDSPAAGNPEGLMPEIDPQSEHQTINSLVTKIVLMVFVGSFASAVLVSWASITPARHSLTRSTEERYLGAAQHAADRATGWLAAGREELARSTAPPWDAARESALAELLANSHYFEGVALCASRPAAADGAGSAPRCPAGTEGLRPRAEWLSLALPDGDVVPATSVAVAREGEPPRLVVGVFDRKRLARLLAEDLPHPNGAMLLKTTAGSVLAGGGSNSPGEIEAPEPDAREASAVRASKNSPRRHAVGAVQPLGDSGWFVAFEIPFGVAYAPLLVLIRRVLLIDLIAILGLSLVAYRVSSGVLKPIESLSVAARRVAEGKFDLEIPIPSTRDEIGVLVRAFNQMLLRVRAYRDEISESNESLRTHNVKLQQANELLEQLSITDGLTKLHNHRFFQDQLTREIRRANRATTPLSLLLIDIDDFKSLNDRFGHAAGDELLHGLALIMNATVRSSDLLARYGGEEFAVLAPGTDWKGAYLLAEKIRTAIAESSFVLGNTMLLTRVTVSVGISQFTGNRKEFFDEADRGLYRAKAAGKNCVMGNDPG